MLSGCDFKQPQCVCKVIPLTQILFFKVQVSNFVSVRVYHAKLVRSTIQLFLTGLQSEIRKIHSRQLIEFSILSLTVGSEENTEETRQGYSCVSHGCIIPVWGGQDLRTVQTAGFMFQ